jgi:D-alanine-D-alanine ligase
MKRKIGLHVACLIDNDIVQSVRKCIASEERFSPTRLSRNDRVRVKYATSVVRVLSNLYKRVEIVTAASASMRTVAELLHLQPDVVFNLAFSSHPAEAPLAGCLDWIGIPYTGSGPLGIALASDKALARRVLHSVGVRTPRFVELCPNAPVAVDIDPPLIVKPVSLASSVGLHARSVVTRREDVAPLASEIWGRYGMGAICEEFIVGREFRAALVETKGGGVRIAGVTEWHFGAAAPGWGFRTEAQRSSLKVMRRQKAGRTVVSPRDPRCAEFARIGRRAMAALRVRGYTIMDLRVDDRDRVSVLEVNPNPGLWADGATWQHPDIETTLKEIVAAALDKGCVVERVVSPDREPPAGGGLL